MCYIGLMGQSIIIRTLITFFAGGCFLAGSFNNLASPLIVLAIIILLTLAMLIFWHCRKLRLMYGAAIIFGIGITLTSWYVERLVLPDNIYGDFATEGTVVAEPVNKLTSQQLVVRIASDTIPPTPPLDKGRWGGVDRNVLVKADTFPLYNYGDKIKLSGTLEKPESFDSGNGKSFDYPNYLLMKYKVAAIADKPDISIVSHNNGNVALNAIFSVKKIFEDAIDKTVPEPEASLDKGILIGSRASFTKNFEEALRRSGTSHIVAISGYNVTIVLMIFFLWVRRYLGFKAGITLGLTSLLIFVVLTGANASIVRAAIMGSLVLFAKIIGRQPRLEHSLFIAAGAMIIINPLIVRFDTGFQLSFLAVLGLIYFAPMFDRLFRKVSLFARTPKIVQESITATLGAQLMTLPLLLVSFGQVSVVAPVVNAIVLPLVPTAMLLSFVGAGVAAIIPMFGSAMSVFPLAILKPIVWLINSAANLPFASVAANNISGWWLAPWFIIVLVWINWNYISKIKSQISKYWSAIAHFIF